MNLQNPSPHDFYVLLAWPKKLKDNPKPIKTWSYAPSLTEVKAAWAGQEATEDYEPVVSFCLYKYEVEKC